MVDVRRRSLTTVKTEFKRVVSTALAELEDHHSFSREHAIRAILHEIAIFTGASAPQEDTVYAVMKSHGLSWEDALRALMVSQAVDHVSKDSDCIASAVHKLTERLDGAELHKHILLESLPAPNRGRSFVPPRISPVVVNQSKHSVHVGNVEFRETVQQDQPKEKPSDKKTASSNEMDDVAAKLSNASKPGKSSSRKRQIDGTNATASKAEIRIPSRNGKRLREVDDDCATGNKRSCNTSIGSP